MSNVTPLRAEYQVPRRPEGSHWTDGYVYVVEFSDGTTKVGRTKNPDKRIDHHRRDGEKFGILIEKVWCSSIHRDYEATEAGLIRYAIGAGKGQGGYEYFTSLKFDNAVRFVEKLDVRSSTEYQISSDKADEDSRVPMFGDMRGIDPEGEVQPNIQVGNNAVALALQPFFDLSVELPEQSRSVSPEMRDQLIEAGIDSAENTGRDPSSVDEWSTLEWLEHNLDLAVYSAKLSMRNRISREDRSDLLDPWLGTAS